MIPNPQSVGSKNIALNNLGTYEFRMRCRNQLGWGSWESVTVEVVDNVSVDIDATPDSGTAPLTTTLNWTTAGAPDQCIPTYEWSGSGNKSIPTGSATMGPLVDDRTYTFGLKCSRGGITDTDEVDVDVSVTGPFCGDGVINQGFESCDVGALNGASCSSLPGYDRKEPGTDGLKCNIGVNKCGYDTSNCEDCQTEWENNEKCYSPENKCGMTNAVPHPCQGDCPSVAPPDDDECPSLTLSVPRQVRKGAQVDVEWEAIGVDDGT
jgi:hypothetical protein